MMATVRRAMTSTMMAKADWIATARQATGNEVDDDCDGAMGDKVDDDGDGARGYDDDDDDDVRRCQQ